MTKPFMSLSDVLKANNYSVTKPRQLVFDMLSGQEPLSMHELVEGTKSQLDRASVYRTITIFEQLGIVRRINIGWKYKLELSDTFTEHHHHLTCTKCKKIIPINENALEDFIESLTLTHHFSPTEHEVEIQGLCESCSKLVKPVTT